MATETAGKTFPTLYKFAKSGAIQQWEITAIEYADGTAAYEVEHGQKGGKIQNSLVEVNVGKNIGKANETTPYDQACKEAESKWKKQLDKNYSEGEAKELPKTDPMLAHKYADKMDKVTYPCHWQPKLDGMRCLGRRAGDEVILTSRKGKVFTTLDHIKKALMEILGDGDIFDGELYCHGVPFQKVSSWIKRLQDNTPKVCYNVYDMVTDEPFSARYSRLSKMISGSKGEGTVTIVHTATLESDLDVKTILEEQEGFGYEGIMLRVGDCSYEVGRRSSNLLKVKSFIDMEFEIVGAEENKGKQKGQCSFVCKTEAGKEFTCKPKGTAAMRREYWENIGSYLGRPLTVRFFEWTTSDDPVPRFPVGVAIREDWD